MNTERDRPTNEDQIEVTQEMIEAGVDAYAEFNPDCQTLREFLENCYIRMRQKALEMRRKMPVR